MSRAKLVTDIENNFFSSNKIKLGAEAPISGDYILGDIIISNKPNHDCYGWICTTSGNPGSWLTLKVSDNIPLTWSNITGKPSTFAPTLGTSSTTAFRGDHGNVAYQHSQTAHAPSNAQRNADITQGEIEAKLRGIVTTHTHNKMDSLDTRDINPIPNTIPRGYSVELKKRDIVNQPPGSGTYTTIANIKSWEDTTGGNPLQLSYCSDLGTIPELSVRTAKMDSQIWGPWYRIFTEANSVINAKSGSDCGFGSDVKPGGFIGVYPGWDENTLYINTYSNKGVSTISYDNVEVNAVTIRANSDLRVKHSSYLPNVRDVKILEMANSHGTCYISEGNGDGASFDTHNLIIRSWWGIGFRDHNNICNLMMSTRTGDIHSKGMVRAEGGMNINGKNIKIQWEDPGDIGEGGIWIRS